MGGGDLQWGKVCNGFSSPLQIFRGEGLQYNTGIHQYFYLDLSGS